MRGLRVLVVDARDLAFGTSSRSSRLIHGGVRYLEQGEIGLVYEALRERRRLYKIAGHLVQPSQFLFPAYRGDRLPLWKLRVGLTLYDALSLYRSRGHRTLGPAAARKLEPCSPRRPARRGHLRGRRHRRRPPDPDHPAGRPPPRGRGADLRPVRSLGRDGGPRRRARRRHPGAGPRRVGGGRDPGPPSACSAWPAGSCSASRGGSTWSCAPPTCRCGSPSSSRPRRSGGSCSSCPGAPGPTSAPPTPPTRATRAPLASPRPTPTSSSP
jgi:hypothetical protein